MPLSRRMLELLDILVSAGLDVEFCIKATKEDIDFFGEATPEAREEYKSTHNALRGITRTIVEGKLKPMMELDQRKLDILTEIVNKHIDYDEYLDEHFTVSALTEVPRTVSRWHKLQGICVVKTPNERVADYLRQAVSCYLYGLPTAAAVLCRSVLEFSLEESLGGLGGVDLRRVDRRDWLSKMINIARKTGTLSEEIAAKADRIRRVGRDAVHRGSCKELTAFETIKDLAEVVRHLYRSEKGGQRDK